MSKITVDFSKSAGRVKPMHAVNNGPIAPDVRGTSNFELYKAAEVVSDDKNIYALAAKKGNTARIMLTFFEDEPEKNSKEVTVSVENLGFPKKIQCFLLDGKNDFVPVKQFNCSKEKKLNVSLYSCYLLSFE